MWRVALGAALFIGFPSAGMVWVLLDYAAKIYH